MVKNTFTQYFSERFYKLVTLDKIRMIKLLEIIQYAFLYIIVTMGFGIAFENLFPVPDNDKSIIYILLEIFAQCILSAIAVFYIRKIVKLFPFILSRISGYQSHKIDEYNGEIIIGLIFVGIQTNLIEKFDILRKKIG